VTPAELCQSCGACCDGTIFASHRDDAGASCPQPCAHHSGGACAIYEQRPKSCRTYECALLQSVKAGRTPMEAALAVVNAKQVKQWRAPMQEQKKPVVNEAAINAETTRAIEAIKAAHPSPEAQLTALVKMGRIVQCELRIASLEPQLAAARAERQARIDTLQQPE